jgi:hypothetical protein
MKIKIFFSIVLLFLAGNWNIFSQTIIQPNQALKSHETLQIKKIETTSLETIISLSIENRRANGSFCADKNIYILYPDGSRIELTKSECIPTCPDTYNFKNIGEVLDFTLIFPPIKQGTEWIDLIEDCNDNCFHFYGVTLDEDLNKRLDEAFTYGTGGEPAKTMMMFRNILESVDNKNPGIEGALYVNIISAAVEAEDKVEAAVWYKRLLSSHAPRLNEFVKFLNDRGIKY